MTPSWFFLSALNYDARSTTHQIYWHQFRANAEEEAAGYSGTLTVYLVPQHSSMPRTIEISGSDRGEYRYFVIVWDVTLWLCCPVDRHVGELEDKPWGEPRPGPTWGWDSFAARRQIWPGLMRKGIPCHCRWRVYVITKYIALKFSCAVSQHKENCNIRDFTS